MIDTQKDKARFLELCRFWIKRDGIENLIAYLEKSDFFTAPASRNNHGNYEGGLCHHSLNVYDQAVKMCALVDDGAEINGESLAVSALLHDLCKVNFYKPDVRNVKVDGEWKQVPYYTIEEKFCFGGHGSKSMFIVSKFIPLKSEEAVAINCHMGAWDGDKNVGAAYEKCTLAWIVHVADEAAAFLIEPRETNE